MKMTDKVKSRLAGLLVFAAVIVGALGMASAAETARGESSCCGNINQETCLFASADQQFGPRGRVLDQFEWNKRITQGF